MPCPNAMLGNLGAHEERSSHASRQQQHSTATGPIRYHFLANSLSDLQSTFVHVRDLVVRSGFLDIYPLCPVGRRDRPLYKSFPMRESKILAITLI